MRYNNKCNNDVLMEVMFMLEEDSIRTSGSTVCSATPLAPLPPSMLSSDLRSSFVSNYQAFLLNILMCFSILLVLSNFSPSLLSFIEDFLYRLFSLRFLPTSSFCSSFFSFLYNFFTYFVLDSYDSGRI